MADYSEFASIEQVTLTGSEVYYDIPANVSNIAVVASEACTMYFESGATVTWPLSANGKEAIDEADNLGGRRIYFGGGTSGTVTIRTIKQRG